MPFSFTEPVVLKIMEKSYSLMPGIQKVVGIFFDHREGGIQARFISHPTEHSIPEALAADSEIMRTMQEERKGNFRTYHWFHQADLPFETERHQEVQMTVFHEMESTVLRVGVENEYDQLTDLLYIYFPENFSTFGLSRSGKSLLPDHKAIIGTILFNSIVTIARMNLDDRRVLRGINGNTRSIIDKYKESQEEIRKMTAGAQRNMVDICRHLLSEITANSPIHYSLTSGAIEKLKKFRGDIPDLKRILENAVSFSAALDFETRREEVRIDEFHIFLESPHNDEKPHLEESLMPSARYAKTIALLDRLEKASQSVLSRDLPLTGANVGSACLKAISAPAISDALKKHRNKIISLLGLYPDRWNLIRSEFKPLINVISTRPGDLSEQEKGVG